MERALEDLGELISGAADIVLVGESAPDQSNGLEFVRDIDNELPEVYCDAFQLRKVFINLIQNAVQAMPDGGTLTIRTGVQNGHAIVTVADTGCGMEPDVRTRIFNPFFTTRAEGTGLGLAIAHKVVRAHGGEIRVRTHPGSGTAFEVVIPTTVDENLDEGRP